MDESTYEVKITPRQYAVHTPKNDKNDKDGREGRDNNNNDEVINAVNKNNKEDKGKPLRKESVSNGVENNTNDIKRDKALAKAKAHAEDLARKKSVIDNYNNKENKENIHSKQHEQMNFEISQFEKNKNDAKQ